MLAGIESSKTILAEAFNATSDWTESQEFPTRAFTYLSVVSEHSRNETSVANQETQDWLASQEFPAQPLTYNKHVTSGLRSATSSEMTSESWSNATINFFDLTTTFFNYCQQEVELHPTQWVVV